MNSRAFHSKDWSDLVFVANQHRQNDLCYTRCIQRKFSTLPEGRGGGIIEGFGCVLLARKIAIDAPTAAAVRCSAYTIYYRSSERESIYALSFQDIHVYSS